MTQGRQERTPAPWAEAFGRCQEGPDTPKATPEEVAREKPGTARQTTGGASTRPSRMSDCRRFWNVHYRQLTEDCVEAFQAINLHWHDLRHEYASRLVERGVPLSQVRDLLGHASITTTERYDNQRLEALQAAAGALESGKEFDRNAPSGPTDFQESFKSEPEDREKDWLGGRDSNPDCTVQSRVSYH